MPKKFFPRLALIASMGALCLALAPAALAANRHTVATTPQRADQQR